MDRNELGDKAWRVSRKDLHHISWTITILAKPYPPALTTNNLYFDSELLDS